MRLISCVSVASIFSCIGLKCGLSSEHVTASVSFSLGMNPLNSHRCVSNSEKNKTWQQLSHLVAKSCHRVLRIHQKWKQRVNLRVHVSGGAARPPPPCHTGGAQADRWRETCTVWPQGRRKIDLLWLWKWKRRSKQADNELLLFHNQTIIAPWGWLPLN